MVCTTVYAMYPPYYHWPSAFYQGECRTWSYWVWHPNIPAHENFRGFSRFHDYEGRIPHGQWSTCSRASIFIRTNAVSQTWIPISKDFRWKGTWRMWVYFSDTVARVLFQLFLATSATDLNLSSAMHNMSIVQTVDQSSNRGSSSRSLPPARSSPRPPPWIHHRVRTLAGVVGSVPVTDDIGTDDAQDLEDFPPWGILGDSAERYLQAHGYKVSAVWSIIHAFKDAFGPDDFMAYVCPKGMPVLEAAYIYELISGRDVWLRDDT